MMQSPRKEAIATSSVEEGLDFACGLLSSATASEGELSPEKAQQLLSNLRSTSSFVMSASLCWRLNILQDLGSLCNQNSFQSKQFWRQLSWIAEKMALSVQEKENLKNTPMSNSLRKRLTIFSSRHRETPPALRGLVQDRRGSTTR